ncbi:type V CRISPR-associated endonuclease Cas1 [Fibrobacter sp. HC4]|uniref:type V CRISPR-associated endonuclease Cas1 n=1 Tax=Fibrobacter sp. HC4 TaxID=3239812 RepID=UPI000DC2C505|nr:type V CRISPR-associated endonuclease Cas1 [Fibrobacter succinogenes]MCL4103291.1 CRISPR-associated endonuclease Cas1 [Fibrobacter succinogenes]MCQ2082728.1 type V CRISPR-associated endonuclease Cas1 [Lachnospiraceae bacterium]
MMSTKDFEHKQIIFAMLNEGEKISFKNDNIVIRREDNSIKLQSTCYRLFVLFIAGHFSLTSGLMERARKFGFTIVFLNYYMRPYAILPAKAEGNVILRRTQYYYDDFDIGAYIISNKIHNQNHLLKKIRNKSDDLKKTISLMEVYEKSVLVPGLSLQEIMGTEGVAARGYFEQLFRDYNWTARRPRVKHDVINCLMDIGYTILFNLINAMLELFGFDTYVGVLHREFFHRKSLACDLVEPFRPIVDASLIKALNLGQIHEDDFYVDQGQYFIGGKNAVPYIKIMLDALLDFKNEIFLYVQSYYRAFVRQKPIDQFPVFYMEV